MAASEEPVKRGRGRPAGGGTASRDIILEAAAEEFAQRGYDGATIRSIAESAGVDTALVHHYFGNKAGLFAAVVDVPSNFVEALPKTLASDLSSAGATIAQFVLTVWDEPTFQARGVAGMRAAVSSNESGNLLVGFITNEVVKRLADSLGGSDEARFRASLVASQVAGLILARYILRLEPIASAPSAQVAAALAPNLQRYLTSELE